MDNKKNESQQYPKFCIQLPYSSNRSQSNWFFRRANVTVCNVRYEGKSLDIELQREKPIQDRITTVNQPRIAYTFELLHTYYSANW